MSTNGDTPATKQDLAKLKDEILAAMREGEVRLEARLKDELLGEMRKLVYDAETHLLNAFYGFAESNRKHLAELDREDGSLRERLGAIEGRVLEIEKRLNFPPPQR